MNFENWWRDKYLEICGTPEVSERDFGLMRDAWETATTAEREACASVCEDTQQEYELFVGTPKMLNYTCADAIRKRSNVELRGCALLRAPA